MYKNKRYLKAFIIIVLIAFPTSGLASDLNSGRIIPTGKVLIYRGDQQVGELTAEAPFPEGALLACDGDCAVRMNDLLLVGADKSEFSVTTKAFSRELLVREGTVYFALSQLPRSLVFVTPKGAVTAQQLILNAAADGGLLKGYVAVSGESAEIGVIDGGSVLVSTDAGETTIQSGKKIILAQAGEAGAAGGAAAQTGAAAGVAIGPAVAGAVGLGVAFTAVAKQDDKGDPASPAAP
jgi:hypothetical protein